MNHFKFALVGIFVFFAINTINAEGKKKLSHDDYNSWKSITEYHISNDGNFICYVINPQEGDGILYVENLITKTKDSIPRGYKSNFSPNSNFAIFNIKPQFDTIRKLKLNKTKEKDLPKDSIGILNLINGDIIKYANIKSHKLAKDSSDFAILFFEPEKKSKDSENKADSTQSKTAEKKENSLTILNPISGYSTKLENIKKYTFSENGNICAYIRVTNDSIDSLYVETFNTLEFTNQKLYSAIGFSENVSIDNKGNQIAFTYSIDTTKNKAFSLLYVSNKNKEVINISGDSLANLPEGKSISKDGEIYFNELGSELYFGIRTKPKTEIKDTLTKDEKVSVDIWNWKDPVLQTQQLKELEKEKKRSLATVYITESDKLVFLTNDSLRNIRIDKKTEGKFSLAFDNIKYQKEGSWDASGYRDYYLIDRTTGDRKLILSKVASTVSLSPKQNTVAWFNISDSCWYVYDIKKEESDNISYNLKPKFYYELNDMPNEAPAYGIAGWTANDQLVVYDRFDLWMFDPKGKGRPQNITNGYGRKNNVRLRYVKLDREERNLADKMLLSAFNYTSKESGYFSLNFKEKPEQLIWEEKRFTNPIKAKNNDVIVWRKQSFIDYPELYVSKLDFVNPFKVTLTNPQQQDFNWGTSELVEWKAYDGEKLQGLLIKPENFDPNKKYPMLVYFYERSSDRLHQHSLPKPIRSVINFSYYASNEYIIFIPDIIYKTGEPGPSAYNCIVSGTEDIIKKNKFIDAENIGIQGQSWGGYQTAYLITRTNIYKAAMAGAPVSNMTSAYGGIRWGSGRSRAFQYEETQSRIGGNLWEEFDLYILNSPLFFVPEIETPLLMMHNDKDGAVPWYQGIEMFNAMRRLDKPVWMLVYNGAPHNLKRRADMKDLTIRMQQYFDYFLKDAPEPKWMKYGVPAIDKGTDFGFELDD